MDSGDQRLPLGLGRAPSVANFSPDLQMETRRERSSTSRSSILRPPRT